jgi:succinate dehydrogenase flavin-adding protein (antitoxin of CptAB toxin-antitoxin module)
MGNINSLKYNEESIKAQNIQIIENLDNDIKNLFNLVRNKIDKAKKQDLQKYYLDLININDNIAKNNNNLLSNNQDESTQKYNRLISIIIRKRLIYRLSYLYINLYVILLNIDVMRKLNETDEILNKFLKSTVLKTTDGNTNLYQKITNIVKDIDKDFLNKINTDMPYRDQTIAVYSNQFNQIVKNNDELSNFIKTTYQQGGADDISNKFTGSNNIDKFLIGLKKDYNKYYQSQGLLTTYTNKIIQIINEYFNIYQNIINQRTVYSSDINVKVLDDTFYNINKWFLDNSNDFTGDLKKKLSELYGTIRRENETFNNEFINKIKSIDLQP